MIRWKRGQKTLSLNESAVVLHLYELYINYKNTSYLFTVQYLIMAHIMKLRHTYELFIATSLKWKYCW